MQLSGEHMFVLPPSMDRGEHTVDVANINDANTSSGSTNWRWIKAKMSSAPAGDKAAPRRGSDRKHRRSVGFWRNGQITVRYIGGQEASFVLCFEGRCWRYPGHWALFDVMQHLERYVK